MVGKSPVGVDLLVPNNNSMNSNKYEGSQKKLVCVSSCALISALNFGIAIGYSSPAIPSMIKRGVFKEDSIGLFGSLLTVGAMIGAVTGGWLLEKIGRKWSIVSLNIPLTVGFILIGSSSSPMHCFVGRLLTGIGSGMVTICVPIYIAEISTPSMRGILGSCVQLSITIGIALCYILGLFFEWRWLAHLCIVPCVAGGILGVFIPETPRRLIAQNNKVEAYKALAAIRDPHSDIKEEIRELEESKDPGDSLSFFEILKRKELSHPVMLSAMIMLFQQLSGINAVMFYTVSIFQTAVGDFAKIASAIIGVVQVFATIGGVYLMDKAGRRKLLQIGGLTMGLTLFGFGIYYNLLNQNVLTDVVKKWGPVVCLTVYITAFSIGWGPVPMLIMSELIPSRCKGSAGSVAIFASWGSAFIVTHEFPALQVAFGNDGIFCFFGLCCMFALWFVAKYVPETKGKSLEEIERYFWGKGSTLV